MDRWMDKEDVVHICNGIVLSHKKEWNIAICSNMDGPRECHTEWSKSKTNIWYRLYVASKIMVQMDLFIKQKESHRCREQTLGYQVGG